MSVLVLILLCGFGLGLGMGVVGCCVLAFWLGLFWALGFGFGFVVVVDFVCCGLRGWFGFEVWVLGLL